MSQNFSRGLENEYLVPYISFSTNPQNGVIAGGGTTTLTAVAAASTGIGYFNYRWYQDDVLSGGITTALSGVTTTRSYTLDYSGDGSTRVVNYKVSAEWVPDNPDLIVSHGTPGVGATGVGVGQSITCNSPSGETFSSVGIVSVSPSITVGIVTVGVQPLGFNTSAYSLERTFSVNATISNGDNGNLAFQWMNAGANVSGATSSSYVFTPGYVGLNTYTCLVSYQVDALVPSVTSDSITDNATDLTQTIRLEYMPAGGEKAASSTAYDVYSEDINLADYTSGFKIDLNHVQEVINTAGSRNTSVYAWENYYYVSMFAIDDDLTVDLELGGAKGDASSGYSGGTGGWMVLQGTMEQNKEFVGIAATGGKSTSRPATGVYELGSVVGIVGNGGKGGSSGNGGQGGADSAGGVNGGGFGSGEYFSANTLPAEGQALVTGGQGRASRCPKGSSWYQNRYGACETFTSKLRDPDGEIYPVATDSNNTSIDRGFKITNDYLTNGAHQSYDEADGHGGSGAAGGGNSTASGGGGGSGYYGGNWTKLSSETGGNDASSRTYTYGTSLTQSVTTDGTNGYIRLFGRGGSAGNNPVITTKTARIVRNPSAMLPRSGLFLDLSDWASTEEVLVKGIVDATNTGSFVVQYLTSGGTFSYAFQGNSDKYLGNMGTTVMTVDKNSNPTDGVLQWLTGGSYYQFRSTNDNDPEVGSGIYQGGENQGGTAGVASGGEWDITLHDNGPTGGDLNTGSLADLRIKWSIQGER